MNQKMKNDLHELSNETHFCNDFPTFIDHVSEINTTYSQNLQIDQQLQLFFFLLLLLFFCKMRNRSRLN